MKNLNSIIVKSKFALAFFFLSEMAFGLSHNYINQYRSSSKIHFHISQGISGEVGRIKLNDDNKYADWSGSHFDSELGIELFKFIQLGVQHSFMDQEQGSDSFESLSGSRFSSRLGAVFSAPVGNLEIGGFAIASRYDYQNQLDRAKFYGSGIGWDIGVNHFFSSKVSGYVKFFQLNEHLVRKGEHETIEKELDYEGSGGSLGIRVWL